MVSAEISRRKFLVTAGIDFGRGQYSGLVGPVNIEPRSNPARIILKQIVR
jgi:hypothetical protein